MFPQAMSSPKTIGRYEILEELGHGAMGTVYRAKDPAMDRVVALKTIIAVAIVSQQGSEFRERFYREARAAGRLAHPGIVPVFDVGEHEGLPYLVMEFISGRTLDDSVKAGERFTLERVCEIGQQIAEALGYAHQHGVIHRDIKPANILLTSLETYKIERPKITDFGIAKLAAGQITLTGQMLGTPAFMPPEQFTGAPVDGRADLFSLGVILYWMATGEQPFAGETMTSVSYKVVHTDPIPPTKLNPSIPPKLESVILKCLAKNPVDRPQSGEELARELAEVRGINTTNLQRTAVRASPPVPQQADFGSQATVLSAPVVAPPQATSVTVAPKRNNLLVAVVAIGFVVLASVSWFALRPRQGGIASDASPAAPAATSGAAVAPGPPPAPPPAAPLPAAAAISKPASVAPPEKAEKVPAVASSAPSEPAPPRESKPAPKPPRTAVVDFDPKSLDANANAKLKIDLPRVPDALSFTVEMNGKRYLQWAGAAKADYQNLFVPPGVQEFRVAAQSGAVRIVSNIVSTEFKAKKRKTLKIELRNQPKAAEGSPALSSDSQIFVTLK
jgi:serine/threonine protein kinase